MENYFNYFTEVEECFRRHRGTPSILSTVDWALIESWKEAGIPLEAVCTGIERTFEKYARRPRGLTKVNSLTYCAQEVLVAADQAARAAVEGGPSGGRDGKASAAVSGEEFVGFLQRSAQALDSTAKRVRAESDEVMAADIEENARALRDLARTGGDGLVADLEGFEWTLTAIEDRLYASLARGTSVELMLRLREELDRTLAACRRTMTAAQIESVERHMLRKRLFDHYHAPRLSIFYMR